MNLKCECYIHSLKQGEKNVLGEATILKPVSYTHLDVYKRQGGRDCGLPRLSELCPRRGYAGAGP